MKEMHEKILAAIKEHYLEKGYGPTVREIGEMVGLKSTSSVQTHLEKMEHLGLIDYSGYLLNYKGYICLWSAIGFGVAGVLWICLLAPIVTWLWLRLSPRFRRNLNALLILLSERCKG